MSEPKRHVQYVDIQYALKRLRVHGLPRDTYLEIDGVAARRFAEQYGREPYLLDVEIYRKEMTVSAWNIRDAAHLEIVRDAAYQVISGSPDLAYRYDELLPILAIPALIR